MKRLLITILLGLMTLPAAAETTTNDSDSYVPHDLIPTYEIFRDGHRWLRLGTSAQVWAVPYVEEDALVSNGDPANTEGFRLRRVRFGASGSISRNITLNVTLNPLESGDHMVHDARITWNAPMPKHTKVAVSIGSSKVPYSRAATESSSRLHFLDRPMGTGDMAPDHRLGLKVEGSLWDGKLGYVAGVYNATDGYSKGNVAKGLLYGGRLESKPLGALSGLKRGDFRMQLGGGAIYEDGPTVDMLAYSFDLLLEFKGVRLRGEMLMDKRTPDAEPELPPTLTADIERMTALGEATALIIENRLELAFRYEWYDNNKSYEDYGDQQLMVAGLNYFVHGHRLKIMANYIFRDEREGRDIDNNAFVLGVVGAL